MKNMQVIQVWSIRAVFLILITSLGIFTIVGSGGGGNSFDCGSGGPGEEWIWNGTACSLRTDGFNRSVSSIAIALDGSEDLYVVGSFTHFKRQPVKNVARLNNDGSLDEDFDSGLDIYSSYVSPQVVVAANDGSGDIYIGGRIRYDDTTDTNRGIIRLNMDGSVDTIFDIGTGINGEVSSIAQTTDGSGDIYIGGSFRNGDLAGPNGPIRLNSDGTVDVGFNSSIRADSRSSIVMAGDSSGDIYVSRTNAPYIARLNSDGSIDVEFDTGPVGFDNDVRRIALATDGSGDIYVGGIFSEYNGTSVNRLARLNSDGSIDTEFVVDTGITFGGSFIIPALDGSGDLYVDDNHIKMVVIQYDDFVRLNDDGSIDTDFDVVRGGFSLKDTSGGLYDAALTTDGSGDIYVVGSFKQYNSMVIPPYLARFTSAGVLVK